MKIGDRGRRLHGSVGQQRRVVIGFDDFGRTAEGGVDIAEAAHNFLRLVGGFDERLLVGFRSEDGVRAGFPFDLEFLAAFGGGPGIVGDDGDAAESLKAIWRLRAFEDYGLTDARDLFGCGIVETLQFAAEDGRALDGGIDHAGHARIESIDSSPRADVFQVDARDAFADVAELGRGF